MLGSTAFGSPDPRFSFDSFARMTALPEIRVGVVGLGFGAHHARTYAQLHGVKLAAVCDLDVDRGTALARELGVTFERDYRRLLGRVDAVSVAVSTSMHCKVSCDFLANRVPVLVEKPMAVTLQEADMMIATAEANGTALQVGHIVRFDSALVAARPLITSPTYFEIHRLSRFDSRSAAHNVVIDLMIHDIDAVLSLVREPIDAIHAVGERVVTEGVDMANARVVFASGCVANLTAGRVYSRAIRRFRCYQDGTYVSLDYLKSSGTVSQVNRETPELLDSKEIVISDGEPLKAQLESFADAVRGAPPVVTGRDGREALKVALAIEERVHRAHH